MLVKYLVDSAIYKSLQDRQHQPVINSGYAETALQFLNLLLDEWRDYIPFKSVVTFNDVVNLSATTFVTVSTVNYIVNNVSIPLRQVDWVEFKELQTIIGLQGWPQIFYVDELTQTISVYPAPSNPAYQFTVAGRIQQINLGLNDEVPANMPPFMANAVIHELGFRLAAEYGVPWSPEKDQIRQSLLAVLTNKKDVDLRPDREIVFPNPNSQSASPWPWFYYLSGGN